MGYAACPGCQDKRIVPYRDACDRRCRFARPPVVAGSTLDACCIVMAAGAVAIDAYQAALLVDIRGQVVILHPVGSGWSTRWRKWRSIFTVVVVLIPTIIVTAHGIAVMTAQALRVRGRLEIVGG